LPGVKDTVFNFPDIFTIGCIFAMIVSIIFIMIIEFKHKVGFDPELSLNLFIDCTQKNLYLALFQEKEAINCKVVPTNNNLTDLIIEHIKKLINSIGAKKENIDTIYLVNGPGSFTGCRMGTLIAKTYMNLKKISIKTISSLVLQTNCDCISILNASGDKFYIAEVRNNKIVGQIYVDSLSFANDLSKQKNLPIVRDYEGINVFKNMINKKQVFEYVDAEKLVPMYVKEISIQKSK